jgi:hypothetical protein
MGLFRFTGPAIPAPNSPVAVVSVTKSIGGMLKDGWDKMGQQLASVNAPAVAAPASAPAYTAFDRRDPFKSYLPKPAAPDSQPGAAAVKAPPPPPPQLRVEGLLWGDSQPKAIINGKLYQVDDRVQGVRILAISRAGVTIEHMGKPIVYSTAVAR